MRGPALSDSRATSSHRHKSHEDTRNSKVTPWSGRAPRGVWRAHWLSPELLNLEWAGGSVLLTMSPVTSGDLYMQRRNPAGLQGPSATRKLRSRGSARQARWQLAVPAHMGTQGWMASANHLLEHFPSQRSNKQHYVENKECTLACPSSDHSDLQPSENSNHRKRVTFIPTKYRHRAAAFTHI